MFLFGFCLTLWSLFVNPVDFSQQLDSLNHLQFLNAEIVTVDAVESAIISKGYVRTSPAGNPHSSFAGTFCGIDRASIRLHPMDFALKGSPVVWKVEVVFPSQDSWIATKERYFMLKDMLTERYDVAPVSVEKLSKKYPEGDDRERWGFEKYYSKWESVFNLPDGSIVLSVRYDAKQMMLFVALEYIDKINYLLKHTADLESL